MDITGKCRASSEDMKGNKEPDSADIIKKIKKTILKTWKENKETDSEDKTGKYRAWFRRHNMKKKTPIQKTWQENRKHDSEDMTGK